MFYSFLSSHCRVNHEYLNFNGENVPFMRLCYVHALGKYDPCLNVTFCHHQEPSGKGLSTAVYLQIKTGENQFKLKTTMM